VVEVDEFEEYSAAETHQLVVVFYQTWKDLYVRIEAIAP